MGNIVMVFLGGGTGAVARYLFGVGYVRVLGPNQPLPATFYINIVGGVLMGLLVGALALRGGAGQERWRVLLGVGVIGGFTTFSSFSLDTVLMIQRKTYGLAAGYVLGSVMLSVLALMAGLFLMRRLTP